MDYINKIPDLPSRYRTRVEDLLRHIEANRKAWSDNIDMWDKQILSIATITIGFSFSVLNNYIDIQFSEGASLFFLSILFLFISIVITVLAFSTSNALLELEIPRNERLLKVCREIVILGESRNIEMLILAERKEFDKLQPILDQFESDAKTTLEMFDKENEECFNQVASLRYKVNSANTNRTIFFSLGMLCLFTYVLINMIKLTYF